MAAEAKTERFSRLPDHIAIVPDGNGRWAEKQGLPRLKGHQIGAENTYHLIKYLNEYPIKYITLFGFSTENWNRPVAEVSGLFKLLAKFISKTAADVHKLGIKIRHIGRLADLPPNLQQAITNAIEMTQHNKGTTLSIAFNYGGRKEILDAIKQIIHDGIKPDDINENLFSRYLYTDGLPDVDLLIRSGDELRLSNFLIWQTTYSEYYFTKTLWPDFGKNDIDDALLSYDKRKRRFGGL